MIHVIKKGRSILVKMEKYTYLDWLRRLTPTREEPHKSNRYPRRDF